MIDNNTILKKKTELLCKGVYLDGNLIEYYKSQGLKFDFGRKGGAGPLGGRYFLLEDDKTLVNVALWNNQNYAEKKTNLVLKEEVNGRFEVYNDRKNEYFGSLKLIQMPTCMQTCTQWQQLS